MMPESIVLLLNNLNMTSRPRRHVLKHRMEEMGYVDQDYDMDALYGAFLKFSEK